MGRHKIERSELRERLANAEKPPDNLELICELPMHMLGWIAYKHGVLSEYEIESCCEMDFTVVKSYLYTHLKDVDCRALVRQIVDYASLMYTVGSRFLNCWVTEKELTLAEQKVFESTLLDQTFLKHAFRGNVENLNTLISQSESYQIVKGLYPIKDDLNKVLSLTAWNNVMGYLAQQYLTNIKLHVLGHLWTRMMGHVKRHALHALEGTLVERLVGNVKGIRYSNPDQEAASFLPLRDLYAALTTGNLDSVPDKVREEIERLRGFFTEKEREAFPNMPGKLNASLFALHLYLRKHVPVVEQEEPSGSTDATKEPVEQAECEESETMERPVKERAVKGWSPLPVTDMGSVFVTIDDKVFQSMIQILKTKKGTDWEAPTDLSSLFRVDAATLKQDKKQLRQRLRRERRKLEQYRWGKKNSRSVALSNMKRVRKAATKCGIGRIPSGIARTVITDGVAICVRYGKLVNQDDKFSKEMELTRKWIAKKEKAIAEGKDVGKVSRPKKPDVSEEEAIRELVEFYRENSPRLIGNDPGSANIFQLAETREEAIPGESQHHLMRFPRRIYEVVTKRREIERLHAEEKATEKGKKVQELEGKLSELGGWKAREVGQYKQVLEHFASCGPELMSYYRRPEFAKWKMLSYRRKDSTITQRFARIVNREGVDRKRPIMIGYGNASFASSGLGRISTPTTKVGKLMSRYMRSCGIKHRIVPIDEYRTTQCCHHCGHRTSKIWDSSKKQWFRDSLLCKNRACFQTWNPCPSSKGPKSCIPSGSVLLNRDANAAINIMKCLEALVKGETRPVYLQRPHRTPSI